MKSTAQTRQSRGDQKVVGSRWKTLTEAAATSTQIIWRLLYAPTPKDIKGNAVGGNLGGEIIQNYKSQAYKKGDTSVKTSRR